jgi:hypothetical protein
MTKTERKAVAKTLREWAAWCEANPGSLWSNACAGDYSDFANRVDMLIHHELSGQ